MSPPNPLSYPGASITGICNNVASLQEDAIKVTWRSACHMCRNFSKTTAASILHMCQVLSSRTLMVPYNFFGSP